ncbi:helix-turn-helix transcriptional regulator [Streptomyces cucumeris]|uniref:helix-turn-helix transcriptional regulator n=1 Tax=Streptomyces cucumeris TaxID=2962890 RepID=UPI003D71B734
MPHRTTPPRPANEDQPAIDADEWYTTNELARLVKVDASTLRRWRTHSPPQGPPFVRLCGRVILYGAADVRQWMASRRVCPGQGA